MMRAALAELGADGYTTPYTVALVARHDEECGCGNGPECVIEAGGARRFWASQFQPERTDLVSARRALHSLADHGKAQLVYIARDDGGRELIAYKCCHGVNHCEDATLKFPLVPDGHLPTYRMFLKAIEAARKRCQRKRSDGNTYQETT
jgi:hypothetical protein